MTTDPAVWDAVVAGAGIAGAAAALDLKRRLGPASRVMLCDPGFRPTSTDRPTSYRAVALAPDMRRFLERLGIWTCLSGDAQPITSMAITDGRAGLLPNPTFMRFGDEALRAEPLAHMVFADPLREVLLDACRAAGVACKAGSAAGVEAQRWSAVVVMADGTRHRTRLLAAADGAQSRLRHAARIQVLERPYRQAAIIATLAHDEDHGGRAVQHFLPAGPIALLPLRAADATRRRISLVWTDARAEAERLAALPPEVFCSALQDRVGHDLGGLRLEDRPRVLPLMLRVARRLSAGRVVLLGDAARVIHPLAGQGLNLGLRDAEALGRHAGGAGALGLDPGASHVVADFEDDRRPETALMAAGTDLLDRLFSTDRPVVRAARDVGLGLVDRLPALKRGFTAWAGAGPREAPGQARRRTDPRRRP